MAIRSTRSAYATLVLGSVAWLAACGDDGGGDGAIDAPVSIDAPTGGDGGGPDAPPAAPSCTDYCTTIAANCTAANLMYANTAECMATCGKFVPGAVGQMSGNTLGCRLYHAGNAAGNPGLHCRHAGPGGDGTCGSNCEGFCTIVQGSCSTQNPPPYANLGACMTACAGYNQTPIYSAAETSGNTFACRLYHATAAANAPGTHCSHTAMTSSQCQ